MSKPKEQERPPIPLPDPDAVRHTFDVAIAKVRERQGFYVAMAVGVVLVAVGVIILLNLGPAAPPSEFIGLWKRSTAVKQKLVTGQSAQKELAALEAYLQEVRGTGTEGEALWLLGIYHYREAWTGDKARAEDRRPHLQKAIGFLRELQGAKFDELLLTKADWFSTGTGAPAKNLLRQVEADLEWIDANTYTEPLPGTSVVAVLRTSEGDVHLQFFDALSPEHVKNFITLALKGTYNETLFHSVRKADAANVAGVSGGDPLTFFYNDPQSKKHILRWGKGGLGYEIPPEAGRYRISHRAGVVTSERMSQVTADPDWDNGAQFMIMTGTDTDLDKKHTPFAKVVEGQGVVDRIAASKTAGKHPPFKDDQDFATVAAQDLVVEPATLHKVIIYENGKALAHDFALLDGEKSLATLSGTPVQPLTGDPAYCGRALRAIDGTGDVRPGLDVPFPEDIDTKAADAKDADPRGARIIPTPRPPK